MYRRERIVALGIIILSLLCIVGSVYLVRQKQEDTRVAQLPFSKVQDAPLGTFTDLDGNSVSLSEYAGKPLLMMAWASWCPACGEQLALLSRVAREEHVSFPLLVINRKESKEQANLYLSVIGKQEGLTYLLDTADHYFKSSEGYAMPELILYSADGTEAVHLRGTFTEEELRGLLSSTQQ